MDEKLIDLLDMVLAERLQLAYFALRESDPQAEELAQELITLSEAIQNSPALRQEDKKRIDEYLSAHTELEAKIQQHLYIQGAKDCVVMLRELGIIR
jgi:uncharacterized membrane protein affecting hemolysin expression